MAYPNTTKQKCPLVPFLRRSNGQTGSLTTFSTRVRVAEAELWSIGIPQKPSWCNTICIQVWCEVEKAENLLRSVGGFIGITSSLVSLSSY